MHLKRVISFFCYTSVTLICLTSGAAERNLLVNPGFVNGTISGWSNRTAKRQKVISEKADGFPDGVNAMCVEVIADGGSAHGQIVQFVTVRPGVEYRIRAQVKAEMSDMAYVQVKQMKGKSEGERMSTAANKTVGEWETLEKVFTTAPDTTAIQVLFRFRMNKTCIGKTVCMANPSFVALDDGDEPAAPYVPPARVADVVAKPGIDVYVTPTGGGRMDGSDWDNAIAASGGGLQKAWDATGPGNSVFVAGGKYGAVSINMAEGGAGPGKLRSLTGVNRSVPGFPRPVFTGSWDSANPARGPTFISMSPGASFIEISNFEIRNYKGVLVARGPNNGLRIKDVDAMECRDAFWIEGGAVASLPGSGSGDIELDGCDVVRYSKRALRTKDGVHHMRILNCVADAGGKDFAVEVFPVGFHILGGKSPTIKDHEITFVNCEARNNWHDAGSDKYWNADGYAAERNTADITFINCRAFGNTDGGWDLKTTRPKFVNCVSIANKRNFRVWTQPAGEQAVFENCLSAFSKDYGNRGHDVGFWIQGGGETTLERCTTWEDRIPLSVESKSEDWVSTLNLTQCVIAQSSRSKGIRCDGVVTVNNTGSIMADELAAGEEIRLKAPYCALENPGDAFDAVSHPGLGYRLR